MEGIQLTWTCARTGCPAVIKATGRRGRPRKFCSGACASEAKRRRYAIGEAVEAAIHGGGAVLVVAAGIKI